MKGWLQENAVLPVLGATRLKSVPSPGWVPSLDSGRAGAAFFTQAGSSHPLFLPCWQPSSGHGRLIGFMTGGCNSGVRWVAYQGCCSW